MIFTSLSFLLFAALVVILYYAVPNKMRWMLMLLASYAFYAIDNIGFVPLLMCSTLLNYYFGKAIKGRYLGATKGFWLTLSLLCNCGVLLYYKIISTTAENFIGINTGISIDDPLLENVIIPLGLSFFTFQAISYCVDIYRGYLKPEPKLQKFALYISFFPQLIAGPIERAKDLIPQLNFDNRFEYRLVKSGLILIGWGFFKKLVVADTIGLFIADVFILENGYQGFILFVSMYLFWLQLFYDFSSYSDIAIGLALLFGVRLSRNFYNHIYLQSFTQFWQEWHITLTTWFRNYVFFAIIKLKNNRIMWYVAIVITFALTGLWHGLRWNFLLWGIINGLLLIFERLTLDYRTKKLKALRISRESLWYRAVATVLFIIVAMIPAVFFKIPEVDNVGVFFSRMLTYDPNFLLVDKSKFLQLSFITFIVFFEIFSFRLGKRTIMEYVEAKPSIHRLCFYLILVGSILFMDENSSYIYFMF